MRKSSVVFSTLAISTALLFHNFSLAADMEWTGVYRIEGYHFKNPSMRGEGQQLDYGLHHLILRPKIIASDGITIYSQFDIFNQANTDANYGNSQFGQFFGHGPNDSGGSTYDRDSNAWSQQQQSETLLVSQLYLTVQHEYGALIVGRAPLQFGLGITYNAGRGLFDHWFDTRDMVGYKFVMGNVYILPMFGKSNNTAIHRNDDVTDYMIQLQYENPETDIEMGLFYGIRKSSSEGSDGPVAGGVGGTSSTASGSMETRTINVYAMKDTERLRLGFEASFMDGQTGIVTSAGEKVSWGGFGIVGELEYRPEASAWRFGAHAGTVTGDDPATNRKFEGYVLDRNYDVAFLLFNQNLGENDFFRTQAFGGGRGATGTIQDADTEAISNVVFLAPYTKNKLSDKIDFGAAFITGWLNTNPISGRDVAKDLGYEVDLSLTYSPRKGLAWVNQVGLLFPGAAFEGGDGLYNAGFTYGFTTKAAISF